MIYDFDFTLDTDHIGNASALEIPISGPAGANVMVILSGTAAFGLDVDDRGLVLDVQPPLYLDLHPGDGAGNDRAFRGQLLVRTGYLITAPDRYVDLGGDGGLQQTTHLTLAHITGDDASGTTVAVDGGDTYVDDRYSGTNSKAVGEVVVRMDLGVQGDCTLNSVAYNVHLLLHKEQPNFAWIHPLPTGRVVFGA